MTMLEKAAKAAYEHYSNGRFLSWEEMSDSNITKPTFLKLAVAVLQAIREPDLPCDESESFTTMIDAIINQGVKK